jgi:hypothetical protein
MVAQVRTVLNWFDVCFLFVVVAAGLGWWQLVQYHFDEQFRADEPRDDNYQLDSQVPTRHRELAGVQEQLAAVRAKLTEQRLEVWRETAARKALLKAFPPLATPAGKGSLALRPDVVQSYVQARTDQDAAARLMKQFDNELIAALDEKVRLTAARARANPGTDDVVRLEGQLASCQERLQAVQKKSAEQRLELARLQARVEALAANYPSLPRPGDDLGEVASLALDAAQQAALSPARQAAAEAQGAALDSERKRLEDEVTCRARSLLAAQREADTSSRAARERWSLKKQAWTGGVCAVAVVIAWLVAAAVCWARYRSAWAEARLPWDMALGMLLVCYAYQAFHVGGAAVAAVTALVLLLLLRWRLAPPPAPVAAGGAPSSSLAGEKSGA